MPLGGKGKTVLKRSGEERCPWAGSDSRRVRAATRAPGPALSPHVWHLAAAHPPNSFTGERGRRRSRAPTSPCLKGKEAAAERWKYASPVQMLSHRRRALRNRHYGRLCTPCSLCILLFIYVKQQALNKGRIKTKPKQGPETYPSINYFQHSRTAYKYGATLDKTFMQLFRPSEI